MHTRMQIAGYKNFRTIERITNVPKPVTTLNDHLGSDSDCVDFLVYFFVCVADAHTKIHTIQYTILIAYW